MDEMGLAELDDIEDDIDEEEERLFEEYRYVCVHFFLSSHCPFPSQTSPMSWYQYFILLDPV